MGECQTVLQITPAFVREAYSLLRQSIIHVEQDDIDFDEEEAVTTRADIQPKASEDDSQDVPMSGGDDTEMTDPMYAEPSGTDGSRSTPAPAPDPTTPKPPQHDTGDEQASAKRRMVITHDKYMTLQSLIVLHLAAVERETGRGIDRDELIDWYLEVKEEEIQDVDELEYEKELITKVLRKLVKVGASVRHVCYEADCWYVG
jgi:DNA replication licensing factor MCM6